MTSFTEGDESEIYNNDSLEGFGSDHISGNNYENIDKKIKKNNNNNKYQEEREKKPKTYVTFKYSQQGKSDLHESIILTEDGKPYFLKYSHEEKKFETVEKIVENARILRPPEFEESPYIPYEFLNLDEINHYKYTIMNEKIDIDYLFEKSKSIISKYNNQDEYKIDLVGADVILSIFQDRFSTIHYVYLVGGNGSGKSSLADSFGAIAYRVVVMTNPTAPNLFRLLGVVEPAQCTLILEEAEKIDKSQDLMAVLKTGSSRNGRVPRINSNSFKQEFFYSFDLKMIVSERSLSPTIARGVNTRIIPIQCFKGKTKFDIKEILNPTDTGGTQNKELLKELEEFRKLLLIYRLMYFKEFIPDIDVNVEGRDKELVKHVIQLFYSCKCLNQIVKSLQKFLDIKNQKKKSSIDQVLLPIISDLIKYNGPEIKFKTFWNTIKEKIDGKEDERKPNEFHTEEYGTIYVTTITGILHDIFGVKTEHKRDGNVLIFDPNIIEKLTKEDNTTIIVREKTTDNDDNSIDNKEDKILEKSDSGCEGVKTVNTSERGVSMISDDTKTNNNSNLKEKENCTPQSNAFTLFTSSQKHDQQQQESKFNNPLISEYDLSTGNYDPEIINNIDRFNGSDSWFCKNCKMRNDKWFMMKHSCKNKKICKKDN